MQLDRRWSRRLLAHLAIDGMWLEYLPQPLGPPDRKLATQSSLAPVRRVLAGLAAATVPDASTSSIVATTLREQAAVLSLLGERETAQTFLARVPELASADPFAAGGAHFAFVGIGRAWAMQGPPR